MPGCNDMYWVTNRVENAAWPHFYKSNKYNHYEKFVLVKKVELKEKISFNKYDNIPVQKSIPHALSTGHSLQTASIINS